MEALLHLSNPPDSYRRLAESVEPGTLRRLPARPKPKLRQIQTRLTSEQLAQLLERYRKGEKAYRLAQIFNIDRRTVASILVKAGVRRPRSMTEEERAEAIRLYNDGSSCARIGKKLNRNAGTVWLVLKQAGVKLRNEHGQPRK